MQPANTRHMHGCKCTYIHILLLDCFAIPSSYLNLKLIISLAIHIYLYMKWKCDTMIHRLVFHFLSNCAKQFYGQINYTWNDYRNLEVLELTFDSWKYHSPHTFLLFVFITQLDWKFYLYGVSLFLLFVWYLFIYMLKHGKQG